ncbi:MAG: glycosyltransferase family 4 protein [Terracidiphilus sp.]|nr:glycosyltransferase family 4 protein [Terracidiphilus sp.]
MKVLYVSSQYPPARGGAEKAVGTLAEAMARSGHNVVVVCLHESKAESKEEINGVRIYRLPIDNIYWPFFPKSVPGRLRKCLWHLKDIWNSKAAKRVGRILDIENPDVVHTHNISGFSVAVWREVKKRRLRLVHTMHDYYLLCIRSSMYRGGACCGGMCKPCKAARTIPMIASRMIDSIISVSGFVLQRHKQNGLFKNAQSSIVYNIIQDSESSHPKNGYSHEGIVFGYIGLVNEEKGVERLLETVMRIEGRNWRLRIAGSGEDEFVDRMKALYTDARIEWAGFVPSREFYQSVDVVVVPSLWNDPLPYVVVEALTANKIMICARSGGIPELASLGKHVLIYDPEDRDGLFNAMNVSSDHLADWRDGGFLDLNARNLFKAEKIVQEHLRLYVPTPRQ